MTVLIQPDFLFVVTYQSVINCLIVHMIIVSFVFNQEKLYIDMSLPFIIKISYSLKIFQLLLSFFYLFSSRHFHLKDYLHGQLGFSVRSKHFSKCSMRLVWASFDLKNT